MSGTESENGWLEAAIAWEVCASLHRQYCKGKDALFTTRQSDFVKHAENARGRAWKVLNDQKNETIRLERELAAAPKADHIEDDLAMAPAPLQQGEYLPLPKRRRRFLCTKCGSEQCKDGTENKPHPPYNKCNYLGFAEDCDFNDEEMRAYVDADRAARGAAQAVPAEPDMRSVALAAGAYTTAYSMLTHAEVHNADVDGSTKRLVAAINDLRSALGQPAPASGKPVAIYRGRCVVDCGEHGHHDIELLKMIPAGSNLYTAHPAQEARLNPDMPVQELRLHMGELTTDEVLVARAAIRWANSQKEARVPLNVDALAQEIRRVDGNHSLGAGALAEALLPWITAAQKETL